jgi:hypothetical protein
VIDKLVNTQIKLPVLKAYGYVKAYYPVHNYFELIGERRGAIEEKKISTKEEEKASEYLKSEGENSGLISKWSFTKNDFTSVIFNLNLSRLASVPLASIKNYFGEKIALYFAFISFYTKYLCFLAPLGILVFTLQRLKEEDTYVYQFANAFFALFSALWGANLIIKWNRKEYRYALEW